MGHILRPESPEPNPKKYPSAQIVHTGNGKTRHDILQFKDNDREKLNSGKLGFALGLPFNPSHTDTMLELEKFEDLKIPTILMYSRSLILDVDGTLVAHHSNDFSPEVVEKLKEIRTKMNVCVFSNNNQEREIFTQLGIPVVKNAAPKPDPAGFRRAAEHYLHMEPQRCVMVGDNLLTDGGCRQAEIDMGLILVDPIPGPEGFFHKLTRNLARSVKNAHDTFLR